MPTASDRKHLEIELETLAKVRKVAPNYEELTADELRQYADHIGAKIRTRMSKPELVKAVAKKAATLSNVELYADEGVDEDKGGAVEAYDPDNGDEDAPASDPLSQSEIDDYRRAIRKWGQKGYPEKCAVLQDCIDRGVVAPAHLLFTGDVRPEKPVRGDVIIPPRTGRGGTKTAWQEFLLATANVEPEVVARLSRDDCIAMAEAKGIISSPVDSSEDE